MPALAAAMPPAGNGDAYAPAVGQSATPATAVTPSGCGLFCKRRASFAETKGIVWEKEGLRFRKRLRSFSKTSALVLRNDRSRSGNGLGQSRLDGKHGGEKCAGNVGKMGGKNVKWGRWRVVFAGSFGLENVLFCHFFGDFCHFSGRSGIFLTEKSEQNFSGFSGCKSVVCAEFSALRIAKNREIELLSGKRFFFEILPLFRSRR